MRRRSAERNLMRSDLISRRALLSQVGGAAALSMTLSAVGPNRAEAQSRPMRLGGPIFVKSDDPAVLAEALGARCCVDISGSYNPEVWYGPHPKNLSQGFMDATAENARKLIDAVKPTRTTFSIEMMPWNLPTGPDDYLRLIQAVDRKS